MGQPARRSYEVIDRTTESVQLISILDQVMNDYKHLPLQERRAAVAWFVAAYGEMVGD